MPPLRIERERVEGEGGGRVGGERVVFVVGKGEKEGEGDGGRVRGRWRGRGRGRGRGSGRGRGRGRGRGGELATGGTHT